MLVTLGLLGLLGWVNLKIGCENVFKNSRAFKSSFTKEFK